MRIVAGEARSRVILAPEGRDTRPTLDRVRENLFNILQLRVRGARVLDLFAGSGALSLEAVSRGAESAVMVDKDVKAVQVMQQNVKTLRFDERCQVLHADWTAAVRQLHSGGARFDLVFLDPPYAMRDLTAVFDALADGLLAENALVVVEHERGKTPLIGEGFLCVDERTYGIAGIRMFRRAGEE